MKNIYEILKSFGIEVPEDKKEAFEKAVLENYKTVAEVNGISKKLQDAETERDTYKTKYDTDIATRDNDLKSLQEQLKDAGVDKTKLAELTTQLETLQNTYETAKSDYAKQLAAQKYEFLVKDCVNSIKFSSNSAKKAFLNDVMAKNLPVEGDKILGFEDFVNAYKEQDADAFIVENNNNDNVDNKPKPHFTGKSNNIDSTDNSGNVTTTPESKVEAPLIW